MLVLEFQKSQKIAAMVKSIEILVLQVKKKFILKIKHICVYV